MRTLADLKRAMTEGTTVTVTNYVHAHLSGRRTVVKAQSKSWCLSLPEGHPKAGEHEGSWLDIPKASAVTFENGAAVITRDPAWGDAGPFMRIEFN